jgi:hypothetical protein
MTNPDNTVGTNAGYDGRTTPNAFNDILGAFTRGIVSGWACTPKTGMTVQLGGDGSTRDVAIAEDNAGNKTTINNRTATPVEITLAGAPATGNRIDSIVAYVDSAQSGQGATDVDFPSITGIIAVSGTAAGSPSAPTETQIRSAITNDGADGAGSFYVILANITVGQGVTTIGSGVISAGTPAQPKNVVIADGAITSRKINWNTLDGSETGWKYLGQVKLTAAGPALTFNLPAQYNNYRIIAAGEMASGSDATCQLQLLRSEAAIASAWCVLDVNGNSIVAGTRTADDNQFSMTGCNQYDTINMEMTSFKTSTSQWRKYQGYQMRTGSAYVMRQYNGRFNSSTEPNQVRIWTSAAFSAGAVIKVWASNN